MSSGIEITDIIDAWIYSTLSGNSPVNTAVGGRIINGQSPAEVAVPFIEFSMAVPATDTLGVGGVRILVDALYDVKVVVEGGSFTPAATIMKLVDALLHQKTVTVTGGSLTCVRVSTFRYPDTTVEGRQYLHVVSSYRILASST